MKHKRIEIVNTSYTYFVYTFLKCKSQIKLVLQWDRLAYKNSIE